MNRIAYICHTFPCLTETFVYREVEVLRRARVPLEVFSTKPADVPSLSPESRPFTADTIYLSSVLSWATLVSQLVWLARGPRRYLRALALVAGGRYQFDNDPVLWLHGLVDFARGAHLARVLAREGGFRHLHAQFADHACTTTLVASLLTGIPFSFRSHTSLNPQIITEKVRRAQFVVSISRYDREVLIQWCGQPAAEKIYVNYLGVPLERFDPESGVRALGRSGVMAEDTESLSAQTPRTGYPRSGWTSRPRGPAQDPLRGPGLVNAQMPEPLILAVGTLCAKKGFEDLVRACRLLVDRGMRFRCQIVGSGPLQQRLEALVDCLELRDAVELSPYQPQEEIRHLLREATIFTLPCIYPVDGTVDGTPVVLMEAMAMGLPVVSTAISGVPELVTHEREGLLVPEKDYAALAEALARLLADSELARRLGAAARASAVRRFDGTANGAELAAVLCADLPAARAPHTDASRRAVRTPGRTV